MILQGAATAMVPAAPDPRGGRTPHSGSRSMQEKKTTIKPAAKAPQASTRPATEPKKRPAAQQTTRR